MGNEKPLVSVVVPLFNMKMYIEECIQSVLNQTLDDWELILVDDGSTDGTKNICDSYAQRDSRIKVIHQENAGVSVARNKGMKLSVGNYIVFADGDDLLSPDSLRCRVALMDQSDMGIAGYECFGNSNDTDNMIQHCIRGTWTRKEALENILLPGEIGYQGYLWNKIFSHKLLLENNIYFQEKIAYNEDRLFVVRYVMQCKLISLTDTVVYRYRSNPDGAMGTLKNMRDKDYDRIMSEFAAYQIMCNMMMEYDKSLHDQCSLNAMDRAIELNQMIDKKEKRLKHDMGKTIQKYGCLAIRGKVSFMKKIKIFGHILLKR